MAHRDRSVFIWVPHMEMVVCRFCRTICGEKSASRHRRNCRQFNRFKDAPKLRRLKKLKRQLATNTNEEPVQDGVERACVKNRGRYVDPSQLVGDRPIQVNLTIESIFRQKSRTVHIPSVEQAVGSFMPATYVGDTYMREVLGQYLSFT
jgi:hypothetical protein